VATDGEQIVGFLACHLRRMTLDGEALRAVCCSHLVVDPAHRGGATGALLVRRCFSGPQDLTISDTAIDVVARVWTTLGGHVDVGRSCEWAHVLRPLAWGAGMVRRRLSGPHEFHTGMFTPSLPVHVAGRLSRRTRLDDGQPTEREPLDAAAVVANLATVTRGTRLAPAYDEPYLTWLFDRMVDGDGDEPVRRLVRRDGRVAGWYVYVPDERRHARVLQVAAPPHDAEAVMGDLFHDARSRGVVLLTGRLEPQVADAVRRRVSAVGMAERHVAHSRRPDVLAALGAGSALLTRLDGEWFA
jgi:hypothetical protein